MLSYKSAFASDRRRTLRLRAEGAADAKVVDDQGYPVIPLEEAQMLDVAGGGMALCTRSEIQLGCRLTVCTEPTERSPDGERLVLEIANVSEEEQGSWRLGCRLVEGSVPVTMAADFRQGVA